LDSTWLDYCIDLAEDGLIVASQHKLCATMLE
jgi:hypothetical protein